MTDVKEKFAELGWSSAGSFAFASTYTPGQPNPEKFEEEVIIKLLGRADHPKASAVRRLYFECYTLVVSDMKRKCEKTESDAPRKITAGLCHRVLRIDISGGFHTN